MVTQIQKRHVITLPKDLRDHMGLSEGDLIIFDLCADGSALVHRYIGHRYKKNNSKSVLPNCEEMES